MTERSLAGYRGDMQIRVAGHPYELLLVTLVSSCGNVAEGIAFRHASRNDSEGAWVISYDDLERIYLAAKDRRYPWKNPR